MNEPDDFEQTLARIRAIHAEVRLTLRETQAILDRMGRPAPTRLDRLSSALAVKGFVIAALVLVTAVLVLLAARELGLVG